MDDKKVINNFKVKFIELEREFQLKIMNKVLR